MKAYSGWLECLVSGGGRQQDQIIDFSLILKSKLFNSSRSSAANHLLFTLHLSQSLKSPEET